MCPIPDGVARPLLMGLAGKGSFFKNHAHKNCTRTPAQRNPFAGWRRSSYFLGRGILPLFVIFSIQALPAKKQRRTKNRKISPCVLLRPVKIIFDMLVFGVQVSLSDRTGRVSWNFIVVPLVLPVPVRWCPLLFLVIVEVNAGGGMLQGTSSFPFSLPFPGSYQEMNIF